MGNINGDNGVWAYVEGGMGSVSQAIANCARSHGANIFTSKVSVDFHWTLLDFLSGLRHRPRDVGPL